MKISELTFTVNKHGGLNIPATLVQRMGLTPGSHIRVAYLTSDGERNLYQEFLLTPSTMDTAADSPQVVSVPQELLDQANIDFDTTIQIVCLDGCIVIARDNGLSTEELLSVLDGLQTANQLASILPNDVSAAQQQLSSIIQSLLRGADPND